MSSTDAEIKRLLDEIHVADPPAPHAPETARFDQNFILIDRAMGQVFDRLGKLEKRPPRPRRTGSAARVNPDSIRLFWWTLGLNVVFAAAALTASYAGLYAMARYTHLPSWLWWIVPLFIDLPLAYSSLNAMVLKRRGQSVVIPWLIMGVLAVASATINVIHVLSSAGWLLTPETAAGAALMGAAPLLLLIGWEEVIRLSVKPPTKAERIEHGTTKKKGRR